mmetsp:Transcript_34333/g.83095  ORF Transcript_34333/g.83095 Transcript_34333/m.83095 type:complete len:197 (+) Transcript_34333:236-826(+)|eukprot:CAMPEP_0114518258 /NCGR_PEP_ID=MMETSP0109-20121206/18343_1 /TAXON_ID=29199 /ORGANISM="Chlorarachnion reptans, Strain CCCM449" /LENGTH=196 /DNA_ID=CAMNT_0001698857 /DNA_START=161 /DNA_END=751 /DNA_ORIENTATION=-
MTTRFNDLKIASKTAAHLKSMLRTQVTQLIEHQRIETTLTKAKLLKRFADKMVTLGKKGSQTHYDRAYSFVRDKQMVDKLFGEMAERYRHRDGGYTRVIRTRRRDGDNAQMAFIEYIDREGEIRKPLPPKSAAEKEAIRKRFLEQAKVATQKIEGITPEMEEGVDMEFEEVPLEAEEEIIAVEDNEEGSGGNAKTP